MNRNEVNHYQEAISFSYRKIALIGKGICIGVCVGAVTSLYRLVLGKAETLALALYAYFKGHMALIPLMFLGLGLLGYGVGCLSARYRYIGGSGIPQVKGSLMGHFDVPWLSTMAAKFVGGAASILAGLSLGREGPSIQLGACVAQGIGEQVAASRTERRILMAGGASAGLAAAFNAPLAGAVFAVEEIFRYLSPVLLLTIMVSTVSADFVSKLTFGLSPVFSFATPASIPLSDYWMLVVLGIAMGCAGALYNAVLLKTQALYRAQKWLPARMRPVVPFLLAGVLGLVFPTVLGGGHAILEHLRATTPMGMLGMILVVKFLFSMISFGSGAPGGIFFPLLILGATLGTLAGNAATAYLGVDTALLNDFVVVAMAGLFSAIVRAPITGVILLLEMTGSFVNLLPLITVSLVAYVVADALKSKPIYDSLLENLLGHTNEKPDCREKITVERIVQHGSQAAGRQVKELGFPKDCLLIAIRRDAEEIIPSGNTQIHPGDYLVFLLNRRDEADSRQRLDALTSVE